VFHININDYIKSQEDEFLEFGKDLNKKILIAAKDENVVKQYAQGSSVNGKVVQFKSNDSFFIEYPDGIKHLYIKGNFPEYRKRFQLFLSQEYNVQDASSLEPVEQVDHLYNKKRMPDYFIRMILLPQTTNRAWGSSYEQVVTNLEADKIKKPMYFLDYALLFKALLHKPWKKTEIKQKIKNGLNNKVEVISKYASDTIDEFKKNIGPLDLTHRKILETYARAEIHYVIGGKFFDVKHSLESLAQPLADIEHTGGLLTLLANMNSVVGFQTLEYTRKNFSSLKGGYDKYKCLKEENDKCKEILESIYSYPNKTPASVHIINNGELFATLEIKIGTEWFYIKLQKSEIDITF